MRIDDIEVKDEIVPRVYDLVAKYYTGRISGYKYLQRMRKLGFTASEAFKIYRAIVEAKFPPYEIYTGVHFSASLKSTSTMGDWAERYLECWLRTLVPSRLRAEIEKIDVESEEFSGVINKKCEDISNLPELYAKCAYAYFESKDYDIEMLEKAEWKFGIRFIDPQEVRNLFEGKKMAFVMDIYDKGSKRRPQNIYRWHNVIEVDTKYWDKIKYTCRKFREDAFKVGYLKSWGKGVRWID